MARAETSAERSRTMSRVRSKDTAPELAVRRAVHAAGFRFRLHDKRLAGTPDLVFPRYRVAVFVHGCFWHWHGCGRTKMPVTNAAYWRAKIDRNLERDEAARLTLVGEGWTVLTVWECDLEAGTRGVIAELAELRDALDVLTLEPFIAGDSSGASSR